MKGYIFHYMLLIFVVNICALLLWKTKKDITITNDFQEMLDKGSKFYNVYKKDLQKRIK